MIEFDAEAREGRINFQSRSNLKSWNSRLRVKDVLDFFDSVVMTLADETQIIVS